MRLRRHILQQKTNDVSETTTVVTDRTNEAHRTSVVTQRTNVTEKKNETERTPVITEDK